VRQILEQIMNNRATIQAGTPSSNQAGQPILPWPERRQGGDGGIPAGLLASDRARRELAPKSAEAGVAEAGVIDADMVVGRLEEAGRTLLALPQSGWTTRLRTSKLDVVQSVADAYGWGPGRARPPVPDSAAVDRMDEALGWVGFIPLERHVLRRIVGARALVNPMTDRYLFSWRRLGDLLGADHKAVQRWHKEGISLILATLSG
jgi:Domain of unknown function (DUF6362)